jgi:hypothetical protein
MRRPQAGTAVKQAATHFCLEKTAFNRVDERLQKKVLMGFMPAVVYPCR